MNSKNNKMQHAISVQQVLFSLFLIDCPKNCIFTKINHIQYEATCHRPMYRRRHPWCRCRHFQFLHSPAC